MVKHRNNTFLPEDNSFLSDKQKAELFPNVVELGEIVRLTVSTMLACKF